jgi:hypothetical protein
MCPVISLHPAARPIMRLVVQVGDRGYVSPYWYPRLIQRYVAGDGCRRTPQRSAEYWAGSLCRAACFPVSRVSFASAALTATLDLARWSCAAAGLRRGLKPGTNSALTSAGPFSQAICVRAEGRRTCAISTRRQLRRKLRRQRQLDLLLAKELQDGRWATWLSRMQPVTIGSAVVAGSAPRAQHP